VHASLGLHLPVRAGDEAAHARGDQLHLRRADAAPRKVPAVRGGAVQARSVGGQVCCQGYGEGQETVSVVSLVSGRASGGETAVGRRVGGEGR
jgi:hypothetical protein